MQPHDDLHAPGRETERLDRLVLAALGEPVDPHTAAHHADCTQCRSERDLLQHTVELAREGVPAVPADVRPPDSVWAGIAAELALGDRPAARHDGRRPRSVRPGRPGAARRWLLAAAAVVTLAGAGVGGYAIGHDGAGVPTCPTTRAALQPMPEGPAGVGGTATVVCSADGPALRVTANRLPITAGYYEVWMYAPTTGVMVAVGTLGEDGSGTFTLPGGMDLRSYPVVDVSAQKYNGDPAHDVSVLRGPLTS